VQVQNAACAGTDCSSDVHARIAASGCWVMLMVLGDNIKKHRRTLTLGHDWGMRTLCYLKIQILSTSQELKKKKNDVESVSRALGPRGLGSPCPIFKTNSVSSFLFPNCASTTFDPYLLH